MNLVDALSHVQGETCCVKCGQVDQHVVIYQSDKPWALGRVRILNGFEQAPTTEYLYRRCTLCRYEWAERVDS